MSTDNNKYEVVERFFKDYNDVYNTENENEKYEKAQILINNLPNEGDIQVEDKLRYYGNASSLYYTVSEVKCKKYGFSDGKVYNSEKILEDNNRKKLEEVLNDKTIAFNLCKKSVDMALLDITLEKKREIFNDIEPVEIARLILKQLDDNKDLMRKISQDLCILFYLIREEEKFILYGDYAVDYNSLNAISMFLKYYCENNDFDNAYEYYDKMRTYPLEFYGSVKNNIMLKIDGYATYWNFLLDNGNIQESLKIGEECREFALRLKLDTEIIKYIEEHIKTCEQEIKESSNNVFAEDILLKYFDNKMLQLMSDDIKIYITTSLNIYEYMKSKEITMDYSANLMPILKAIESMIFEIVGKKYRQFLLEKNDKTLDKRWIDKAFLNPKTNKIATELQRLELGTALNLMGFYDAYGNLIPNCYFIEFCNRNNIKDSRKVIIKTYKDLKKITRNRNLVAHKDRVYEERVKECYDILLDDIKFINYLYSVFKFVFENE